MRGWANLILAAALVGLLGSGCGISAITAGIVMATRDDGGGGEDQNGRATAVITSIFPPGAPLQDSVPVNFTISDAESDLVDLLVEVSQDGGVTWVPAQNIAGTTIGLPTTPVGVPGTVSWDTYADAGSTVQTDIRLRMTPYDPKVGISGTTANLTVDNTHRPDIYEVDNDTASSNPLVPFAQAQVHSIHELNDVDYVSINVTAATERYTVETSNLSGGDTALTLYDVDGILILATNDDKPGGGLGSRIDFIFPAPGLYYAQVRDSGGGYLYSYELDLVVVPPTAPSCTVETPLGPVFEGVTISYILIDPDENLASILVEFSQDGGVNFVPATEVPGLPSEGTTALVTTALGETHQFVWDSEADIGLTDQSDIQIRITPSDLATGTSSTTTSFRVDNVAPRISSVEFNDPDLNGPDYGDTLQITFSEEIVLGSQTPAAYFLPVSGDTLGDSLTVNVLGGPGPDQVRIELGTDPVFSVAGLFDPLFLGGGNPSGLDVSAALPSNAIVDVAGNEATNYGDPVLDDDGVDLSSQDTTAPSLTSASAQALAGAFNDEVRIEFSEPVIPGQAEDRSRYALESPSGSFVDMGTAQISYDPTIRTTTIRLTDAGAQMDNLLFNGSFRITVTGVADIPGNPITPGSSLAGTVGGDSDPPGILSANQGPGGNDVLILFDEVLDLVTANDPVHFTATGVSTLSATLGPGLRQVTVIFDAPVTPGTTTLDVSDVRDLAGNPMAAVVGKPIGGSDGTPPALGGIAATAIPGLGNDTVTVTFTEPVNVADATTLTNFALESPVLTSVDVTGSSIAYSQATRTTTITLSNAGPAADNLQFGATARVTVSNVRDLAGNPINPGSFLDGAVGGDGVPPLVLFAQQNLTDDPSGATVDLQFSEALDATSAETPANYGASGGITSLTATLLPGAERVRILLDTPVISGGHTFNASGVKDAAGNVMLVAPPLVISSTDSTPPSAVITDPLDGSGVPQSVVVSGTASDAHSRITAVRVNGTAASTGDDFANWTAALTLPLGTQSVTVETEDFGGNIDPAADSITVSVAGNTPPKAVVATPGGTQMGDVPINYDLIDADLDLVGITVEFSTDAGAAWAPGTESIDPLSEGTVGLSSSPDPGTPHVFVWDSLADMGPTASGLVRIRITPDDGVPGTAGTTANFTVNNAGDTVPFVVAAVYDDWDGNGVGSGDRIVVIFNEPVQLQVGDTSPFVLPVPGDSFGGLATSATGAAPTEVVISLGTAPVLTIPGPYVAPVFGMPSGVDISSGMPAGAVIDAAGNDAVPTSSTWEGGAGTDGAFDSSTYVSGNIPGITKVLQTVLVDTDDPLRGGVYEFTTFTLAVTHTLQAIGDNPLVIRATGPVVVEGSINLAGLPGGDSGTGMPRGGGGGPAAGGNYGGAGGRADGTDGSSGQGPGGGGGGTTGQVEAGGGGGGASFATLGDPGVSSPAGTGGRPGAPYGDPYLFPIRGGSGGGGGGGLEGTNGGGAGGGGGGGAIRISSGSDVTVNGGISVDGGPGGNSNGTSGGAGGSGGSIHIQAQGDLLVAGTITALGGAGGIASGSSSSDGGTGGGGRIRLEDADGITSGAGTVDPTPTSGTPTVDVGGGFRVAAVMSEERWAHSTVLLRDGTVLVGGGHKVLPAGPGLRGMFYDPINEDFTSLGSMRTARAFRGATALPSGDILISGGVDVSGNPQDDAEIYRVSTGTFEALPLLSTNRGGHTSTLLPDGLVLLAGGREKSAEVFDWVLESFTPLVSEMSVIRTGHTATLLGDGRLLIAGGETAGASVASTEWFDIQSQVFGPGPSMNEARAHHVAVLLPTGRILMAGGEDGGVATDTAELFDPVLNTFFPLAPEKLSEPRTRIRGAGRLPDGSVLLPGGCGRTADIFDPRARTFGVAERLPTANRRDQTITTLPSGQVLSVGGEDPVSGAVLDSTEIFIQEPRADWMTMLTGPDPGLARDLPSGSRLPDGKVLLAGGNQSGTILATTVVYDPALGFFVPGADMGESRVGHAAVVLPTGEILVIGGTDDAGFTLNTAEIYDPTSGLWTSTLGTMGTARAEGRAALLWTGEVLVCGGKSSSGLPVGAAELFDPVSQAFAPTVGAMQAPRLAHDLTPLGDGRVLLTGGLTSGFVVLGSTEIYDPVQDLFTPSGDMGALREGHTATLLPDGRVFVAGGSSDIFNSIATTELFDPLTGLFAPGPNMVDLRFGHAAILLPNGTVMIAGGRPSLSGSDHATAEIFSPRGGSLFPTGSMGAGRFQFPLVLLGDGRVLAVGGSGAGSDFYVP